MTTDAPVLALDIGGTKIAAGLVDGDGEPRATVVRPLTTAAKDTADGVWAEVVTAVRQVLPAGAPIAGVGVGCAGPVHPADGTVSPINIPAWRGFPLAAGLRAILPGVAVRLAGDVVCLALGERWRGAAQGSRYVLGLVVSTGVGGGLVLDGRPYGGRTGNAGHVGHLVVEPDGHPCSCGGRGCVETVAAGPHLVRWARAQGWSADSRDPAPPSAAADGVAENGGEAARLAADARRGDAVARAAFERGGHAVGLAIAGVAAVCDLDLVVLGGGVAQAGALLLDPIRRTVDRHARLSFLQGLRVLPAELGAAAGLIGAAALVHAG